jgi:hypothetical protein
MSYPFRRPEPPFTFDALVSHFHGVLEGLPDQRTGNNTRYSMKEAGLGAFSVFFTQCPSFLAFQQAMAQVKGQSNAHTWFQMEQIPCDNRIRTLWDPLPPTHFFPVFSYMFERLPTHGYLPPWRSFDHHLLVALDATEYFSSPKIHCQPCSQTHPCHGTVTYSHQAITPVLVAPGHGQVISLAPEFITPQDGHDKQDCETAAAKRWLAPYGPLGVTGLGDDRYCHQPLCEAILAANCHFLLVCKPDSHKTRYDWLAGLSLETVTVRRWTGKRHEIDTYRYLNHVPLRDGDDALWVNGCELTTTDSEGNSLYNNAFATSHPIPHDNVIGLVAAGRARWKIENENHNVLNTKGYHLEHNYGHGKQHLSGLLLTLHLLAFLFHTVLELMDRKYQLIRHPLPNRETCFNDLRALTRYRCFDSGEALLDFMIQGLEIPFPDTS